MSLREYERKRDFKDTPEPKARTKSGRGGLKFVVQKHAASHLHYDVRLEMDGVLKSWAVPKGPSLNPADKRLAMHVEDHPLDYLTFEGVIPSGQYGAGQVIVWDIGTYATKEGGKRKEEEQRLLNDYKKGHLSIVLSGKKLNGEFTLIRTNAGGDGKERWLLVKKKDAFASRIDVTDDDRSVLSPRRLIHAQKGRRSDMPAFFKPMLATLIDHPFDDDDWVFEIKWDGYRALSFIQGNDIVIYSRNKTLFNQKFSSILQALRSLRGHSLILDGEIVALDAQGRPDFQTLQRSEKELVHLRYAVFDLLYMDGQDLRDEPLLLRKGLLKQLLQAAPERIMYSDHVVKEGISFFRQAEKLGLEGIIAKRADSRYHPGVRAKTWLKMKTVKRQEAVIAGFTEPRGSRKGFGALILGVYEGDELNYIGHTGGGFDAQGIRALHQRLLSLKRETSPFRQTIRTNAPVTWVEPKLVCEVKFSEWTRDNTMRQPIFIALREDKPAREVVREEPLRQKPGDAALRANKRAYRRPQAAQPAVKLTNTDKIFWPKEGYTKGDVIAFYERMAPYILPYLKDRPESLLRHPNGIEGKHFFQKNIDYQLPPFARTVTIESESEERPIRYLVCDNRETLLYMVNLGCIELNPWNSRIDHVRNPDYMIIDIDPAKQHFSDLIKVARETHKVLDLACQQSYIKTSGKRGLHVVVPLGAQYDYDQIRQFAELIANLVHRRLPQLTSVERRPSKRKGKIYIDYLQNRFAQTLAAPYCLRPWPGATVSTPLKWTEVKSGLNPNRFTIETVFKRLNKVGDLWEPVLNERIDLAESIACLQREWKATSTP